MQKLSCLTYTLDYYLGHLTNYKNKFKFQIGVWPLSNNKWRTDLGMLVAPFKTQNHLLHVYTSYFIYLGESTFGSSQHLGKGIISSMSTHTHCYNMAHHLLQHDTSFVATWHIIGCNIAHDWLQHSSSFGIFFPLKCDRAYLVWVQIQYVIRPTITNITLCTCIEAWWLRW